VEGARHGLGLSREIEEGSIRLRSPAAPEGGAEEKGRVTPLRVTGVVDGASVRPVEVMPRSLRCEPADYAGSPVEMTVLASAT
jgi:hypothetical protein